MNSITGTFQLKNLPPSIRKLIFVFTLVLSIGYVSAFLFVEETTEVTASGVIENYNGNEDNDNAEIMKFRKSKREMLNIIHTHILSMSLLFLVLALLVYGTMIPHGFKTFLMIEPMLSVLITFGSIYFTWLGWEWMAYVVMVSGTLMNGGFVASILVIWRDLFS